MGMREDEGKVAVWVAAIGSGLIPMKGSDNSRLITTDGGGDDRKSMTGIGVEHAAVGSALTTGFSSRGIEGEEWFFDECRVDWEGTGRSEGLAASS